MYIFIYPSSFIGPHKHHFPVGDIKMASHGGSSFISGESLLIFVFGFVLLVSLQAEAVIKKYQFDVSPSPSYPHFKYHVTPFSGFI